jgi:hypothetical protein
MFAEADEDFYESRPNNGVSTCTLFLCGAMTALLVLFGTAGLVLHDEASVQHSIDALRHDMEAKFEANVHGDLAVLKQQLSALHSSRQR